MAATDPLRLLRLNRGHASALAALARRCYVPYYADLWLDGGMAAYLADTYEPRRIAAELDDPAIEHAAIEHAGQVCGFVRFHPYRHHPLIANAACLERIYLAEAACGRAIGQRVMKHYLARAARAGREWIWLQAMADNHAVRATYARLGFRPCATDCIDRADVRPERAAMVVMRCELEPRSADVSHLLEETDAVGEMIG